MGCFVRQFTATYRWHPDTGNGLEHLYVKSCENNVIVSGKTIGNHNGQSYGIGYTIICSSDWIVRAFTVENTQGQSLSMSSDEAGNWFSQDGMDANQLYGAIDLDFSGTPFTHTLPVRRMGDHRVGKSQRFKMVHVPFDTLEPKIVRSQYYCVIPYRKYRCQILGQDLSIEFEVDENGIVLDLPGQFIREI